ncbi:DsbA family oxidoreductase, partial [Polymorphobacter fuscus]
FQPFELNPDMPLAGENVRAHLARKYGADPVRVKGSRNHIRDSAAEFGFTINGGPDSRIWNSFDAHRLLHWAGLEGRQAELKIALFTTHFTDQQSLADPDVLVAAAVAAGLDGDSARAVLTSGAYIAEVRADERHWREQGIAAVPAVVIDGKYLITGGQPVAVFEKALRRIAAEG